ncbi:MAG: envelope stress response membrane protein PspB [Alphaproteobacteria bacterium]|jgi:phage shock protein B|nr:MAG: envelope stress response membrane protein PspB [Alphaproteobacteria bacterium]
MDIEGLVAILCALVGLPWLIMHYVTKWKQAPKITTEDEQMLDEMYNLARRLEERVQTVERIVAADNPDWKPGLNAPQATQPLPSPRYTDRNSNRSM